MVFTAIAIGVSTAIALAVPLFFPTPAEKATIELNEKLGKQSFLTRTNEPPKSGASKVASNLGGLLNSSVIAVMAVVLIIILVLSR